jgi:CysZ protein
MVKALFLALGDLASPRIRSVLPRAVALTLGLFIAVLVAVEVLIAALASLPWPWAEAMLAVGTGVVLTVLFFFLMAPVTAIFAGFFLDGIAAAVERVHYAGDPPGAPPAGGRGMIVALQFAAVVLAVNIAALPLILTGIGAFVLIAINAYLIGREYFEMAAMRHLSVADARQLRKLNAPMVFAAGVLPAVLSLVPLVNLAVPLFATAYFVHLFKSVERSSA